jgi:hypothetical protein
MSFKQTGLRKWLQVNKTVSHNYNYLREVIAKLQASTPACESHQQAPIYKAFERKKKMFTWYPVSQQDIPPLPLQKKKKIPRK